MDQIRAATSACKYVQTVVQVTAHAITGSNIKQVNVATTVSSGWVGEYESD